MKRFVVILAALALLTAAVPVSAGSAEGMDPAYEAVMQAYRAGLSGNGESISSGTEDFNSSAWLGCADMDIDPAVSVGYALMDLDGDGRAELLIGDATSDRLLEGVIFDVWTVFDGEAVLIRRGWERWRLYLAAPDADGCWSFYQEGSSGASNSVYDRGRFLNGKAVTEHTLEYDEEYADLWHLDGAGISEEAALATVDAWSADLVPVELTPFAE